MDLKDSIYKRRSVRKYLEAPLSEDILMDIRNFIDNTSVLNPDIKWSYDIVGRKNVKTLQRFKTPHYLLLFSETKDNYLQNIGFIFQQVDLYMQSRGIGSCWVGAGGLKDYAPPKGQDFVIMIVFGNPKGELYRELTLFNRKLVCDISDERDSKLNPARYAPSSVNSQPWYFLHTGENSYNVYRNKRKLRLNKKMEILNQIDIGIALAHMYVANPDTFRFTPDAAHEDLKNKVFEGRLEI